VVVKIKVNSTFILPPIINISTSDLSNFCNFDLYIDSQHKIEITRFIMKDNFIISNSFDNIFLFL